MMSTRTLLLIAGSLLIGAGVLLARSDSSPSSTREAIEPPAGARDGPRRSATAPAWRRRGRAGSLTEKQEAEILRLLKDKRPGYYERLVRMRAESPERYRMALRAMYGFLRRWRGLPEDFRNLAMEEKDARIRIVQLIRRIHASDDADEQDKLKQDLREAVAQHFEAEQKLRERRLAHLEQEIKRLRDELAQDRRRREELIDQRVQRWLRRPTGRHGPPRRGHPARPEAPGED